MSFKLLESSGKLKLDFNIGSLKQPVHFKSTEIDCKNLAENCEN